MSYLALNNDKILNGKFVNYSKLILFWMSKDFENKEHDIVGIAAKYAEYINEYFPDLLVKDVKIRGKVYPPGSPVFSEKLDKYIKNKYQKGWTGLTIHKRLEELKKLAENKDYSGFYITVGSTQKIYKHYCNHTHPTPYSCIPHFIPKSLDFKFEYSYSSESLLDIEKNIFLLLDFALMGFGIIMGYKKYFCGYSLVVLNDCNNLGDWIQSELPNKEKWNELKSQAKLDE